MNDRREQLIKILEDKWHNEPFMDKAADAILALFADDIRDAERYQILKKKANQKTAYDVYGNGGYWTIAQLAECQPIKTIQGLVAVRQLIEYQQQLERTEACRQELREIAEAINDPRLHNTITIAEWAVEVQERLTQAESALERKGYRRSCDIPACNCGDQWTHGGHAERRLSEIGEALEQADAKRNGETILADVVHALSRADRLEAALRLANGALMQCSPCMDDECAVTQKDWLDTAIEAARNALEGK